VQSKCLAECNAKYVIGMCNCKDIYMSGKKKCDVCVESVVTADFSRSPFVTTGFKTSAIGLGKLLTFRKYLLQLQITR